MSPNPRSISTISKACKMWSGLLFETKNGHTIDINTNRVNTKHHQVPNSISLRKLVESRNQIKITKVYKLE